MDREWPEEEREALPRRRRANIPSSRASTTCAPAPAGAHRFVQFHVWVPADWTVREAHDRMDAVEEKLQQRFPGDRDHHPSRPRRATPTARGCLPHAI